MKDKILIIKHGSLGDIIAITGCLKSIREFYNDSQIHILTNKKYNSLFLKMPFVDSVIIDERKSITNIYYNFILLKNLINMNFTTIIDLQNSTRTSLYSIFFKINAKPYKWFGTRYGANFRIKKDKINSLHVYDGHNELLNFLGIKKFNQPNVSWLAKSNVDNFPKNLFLLNIGSSSNNLFKRWPLKKYLLVADWLIKKDIIPIIIGTSKDIDDSINFELNKNIINLIGKSPLELVASLAKVSIGSLSNDTGPAHIIAAIGNSIIILAKLSRKIDLVLPKGDNVQYILEKKVNQIEVKTVINKLEKLMK